MAELTKTILNEWKEKTLPEVISRETDLLGYADTKPNKIVVITGFRRTGKTFLIFSLIQKLLKEKSKEQAVYINFEDEMIIAVFQGTFGSGHGIEIIRIIEEENSLEVLVEENLEPGGATVSTQPYHVIKTKRYYGNLTFADNRFPIVKSKLSGPLRVLKNGESTTYVINGRDYDVVTEIKGDPLRATFVMNGELFELKEGETHTSAGGLNVEVHNIEGNLVEFEIY